MSRLKHHVPTLVLKCQHGFWDSDMDKGPKQPQEPGHLTCLYSFSMFRGCIVFMSKYVYNNVIRRPLGDRWPKILEGSLHVMPALAGEDHPRKLNVDSK